MDINLTGQILNLPFSLIGHISDSPWYYPLINPLNWLPLLVVIIGAYATYFYTNRLEDRKNRYDLKVKIYFEILDLVNQLFINRTQIYTLKSIDGKIDINKDNIMENDKINYIASEKASRLEEAKEQTALYKRMLDLNASLLVLLSKLQVICNEDVYRRTSDFYIYVANTPEGENDNEIFANKQRDLTNAIRKDLGGKDLDWFG